MNRRTFVCTGATVLSTLPFWPTSAASATPVAADTKPAWLRELITINDQQLKTIFPNRITDPNDPNFGGVRDGDDIPNPHSAADLVRRAACAMSCPESSFYRSTDLLRDVGQAVDHLLKIQHADGTIDLLSTNFHSTPDTGFIVKRLVPAYTLLERSATPGVETPGGEAVLAKLKMFLLRAGEALSVGGIHTPNHRWVVSAALTKLNERWPNPRYVVRVNQWLGERIDMDSEGQYNERSTLIYSPLTDRLLITIARGMNKPELLDYVRRNLKMTLFYVHPNGEVVSEASGRQDKAIIGTLEGYYYAYRYMALRDNDGEMAAMCHLIEQTVPTRAVYLLDYLLEDTSLWKDLPAPKPLPTNYVKAYPHSGLVRIRRGMRDATLLSKSPVFLTFHKGGAIMQGMRVASSFFGKGQFQTEKIVQEGDTWVLTQSLDGPYYQPYPVDKLPPDGDWEKMDRANRPQSEVQHLKTTVTIRETPEGIQARIQSAGTEGVPLALELIFRSGGTFAGVTKHPARPNAYLLNGSGLTGPGTYTVGTDTITFGPGESRHKNVQLRGSLPATDMPTVYVTGFTPFDHTITLT